HAAAVRAAGPGRIPAAVARGRELPRRRRGAAALLRGRWRGTPGHFRDQEAQRCARTQHPRDPAVRGHRHRGGCAAAALPRRAHGHASLPWGGRGADGDAARMSRGDALENRVLVHAPSGKDATLACEVLTRAGIHCHICPNVTALEDQLAAGAAAVLLTEEALTPATRHRLRDVLGNQPRWSDLPLVVLMRPGPPSPLSIELAGEVGNVTLVEDRK